MENNKHPMKVAMVSILVADPVKAFKYYTETLGFKEVMYDPDNYLAIVQSPLSEHNTYILLEPTEPGGIEIAKKFKKDIYDMGMPIMSFSSDNIQETVKELKEKGVHFKKDLTKTDYGFEAIFDDDNGNFLQLIEF